MAPKRFWTEMTWEDFRDGDPGGWIAVLPVAAVEQHGPHLPLGVDGFIAEGYLARTRTLLPSALPVTFLPLQFVGKSDEHLAFPGTLTLSAESAIRAWTEIGESVHRAGVEKIVIVSSHGGNSPIIDIVARNLRVRFGMLAVTTSWHRLGYPKGLFSDEELLHGIHAGEIETSLMLAIKTETVRGKMPNAKPSTIEMEREFKHLRAGHPAGFAWMTQDLHASGAAGNAAAATLDKGEAALDFGARAFVALLEDVHRFDLARLKEGPLGEDF
ncbi:MAG TPA: creatininase family protein [Xanthobacteraceae bacterium]|nr:creatininase family protein [Xanthobacteraceae bacterium]